jgi:hypothetical protein
MHIHLQIENRKRSKFKKTRKMQNKKIENQKKFQETNSKDVIINQIFEGKKLKINICGHNKRTQFLSRTTELSNFSTSC